MRHVEGDPDTSNNENDVNNIGDKWCDGRYIYTYYGASTVEVNGKGTIAGAAVASSQNGTEYVTEIKIPRVLPGGSTHVWYPNLVAPVVDGLRLEANRTIGLNVTCSNLAGSTSDEYSGTWTGLFETHSYEIFPLEPHFRPGDTNCDGAVDFGDINPFVLALTDPAGYQLAYPNCSLMTADANGDGRVDFGDINPFVALLSH